MQQRPHGAWRSPLSSAAIVAETVALSDTQIDADAVLWQEGRPGEKGRVTLLRRAADGSLSELTPAPFNVRTRVHEYGGRSYLVAGRTVFFSHFADQRLYRSDGTGAARAITPDVAQAALRYADLQYDAAHDRLYAVREDHRAGGEAVNTLVLLNALGDPAGGTVLAGGCDFYCAPRLSPDGQHLAWIQWCHPNMPWDGTELMLAPVLPDGSLGPAQCVAGGAAESVCQPLWSPAGELHFVSDKSGWWNLTRWRAGQAQNLAPLAAEFGVPHWNFGASSYAFDGAQRIVCAYSQRGSMHLALLCTSSLKLTNLDTPYRWFASVQAGAGRAVCVAGSPLLEPSVVSIELNTGQAEVLKRGSGLAIEPGYTSVPQAIEFPTAQGRTAHGLYYPPENQDFAALAGEKPPLLVFSHGGPTAATVAVFKAGLQYWTSRGFAVLDVNYGGSTGHGREYRERLKGQWGVVDVEDCVHGAQHLVAQGLADGARLIIRGGSAGGFTTLAALTFHKTFAAGASHYGIGDLEALARDTHKFEARYLDSLIGPWPERADLYRARSPIHHTAGLNCPLILFQGSDDLAVPPEQSRQMHAALKAKGLPVAYIEFAGEGHGFRQAANIRRAIDAEAYFYSRVFGFELADAVEPVLIDNL